MAQLVARFHGMEEVRGSNPLSSTQSVLREPVTSEDGGCSCKSFRLWFGDDGRERFGEAWASLLAVGSLSVALVRRRSMSASPARMRSWCRFNAPRSMASAKCAASNSSLSASSPARFAVRSADC